MINVGLIGFGFMGRTHAGAFLRDGRARIAAVANDSPIDFDAAVGNIDSGDNTLDPDDLTVHEDAAALLADPSIAAVSICTPTPSHVGLALAALDAGKHVLIEKPIALTGADAQRIVDAAHARPDQICMPAMCMRYWPGWTWLRETIRDGTYGRVRSATFSRRGGPPDWSPRFYHDPKATGGAALDLHIHDADFIRACFGDPSKVESAVSIDAGGGVNRIAVVYRFEHGPDFVLAEGGWMTGAGYPFSMQYVVNFDEASARFELDADHLVTVHRRDGVDTPDVGRGTGYDGEISAFLTAVETGQPPAEVAIEDGAAAVALVQREIADGR